MPRARSTVKLTVLLLHVLQHLVARIAEGAGVGVSGAQRRDLLFAQARLRGERRAPRLGSALQRDALLLQLLRALRTCDLRASGLLQLDPQFLAPALHRWQGCAIAAKPAALSCTLREDYISMSYRAVILQWSAAAAAPAAFGRLTSPERPEQRRIASQTINSTIATSGT